MVYLTESLVVMADRLKIVKIRARNVPSKRTQAPRRRRISRISVATGKQGCRVLMSRVAILLKHKKIISKRPAQVWQWPLSKKVGTPSSL